MAYDPVRRVTVIVDGDETREWDGIDWVLRDTGGLPALSGRRMVYDESRAVMVMFGGSSAGSLNGDTWEWDGAAWSLGSTIGPPCVGQ